MSTPRSGFVFYPTALRTRLDSKELLSRGEACGHDFVYGELLIGDLGGPNQLLADYEQMYQAPVVLHDDVVAFVRNRRIHGRGTGWIDAHLQASSLVERWKLWTTDPRLIALAKELGVAYDDDALERLSRGEEPGRSLAADDPDGYAVRWLPLVGHRTR